jgi:hypothetical protein
MNTIIDKRVYSQPEIMRVELDNEISLALESNPAIGPNEVIVMNNAPDYFNIDPFKSNMG